MIDISAKITTLREAVAEAKVLTTSEVIELIKKDRVPKGNVLEAAKLAGILAAKKTPYLIPLCHPIPIEYINIEFSFKKNQVNLRATVKARAKTGVEMEALTAASLAALTIYDMCKPLDKGIVISDIKLLKKTGGKSGTYVRKD